MMAGISKKGRARQLSIIYLSRVRQNPYVHLLAEGVQQSDPDLRTKILPSFWRRLFLPGFRPHVLHLHWAELQYSYGGPSPEQAFRDWRELMFKLRFFRWLGGKIVYTVHNLGQHEGLFPDLDEAANRWLFAHADAIHVHDAAVAAAVAEHYGRSQGVYVIPHGHYIGAYPDETDRAAARAHLGLDPDRFLYLSLGQIRPYKGIEELIAAFMVLADPGSDLLIAGNIGVPAYGEQIRALTAQNPTIRLYPNFIADDELQYFFHAADVCVLPYRRATTSGAALLAFSFGTPIIAPAIGPFPDLISGSSGVLFPPGEDALVQALRQARSLDLAAAAAACLDLAAARDWRRLGAEHAGVYRRLFRDADKRG